MKITTQPPSHLPHIFPIFALKFPNPFQNLLTQHMKKTIKAYFRQKPFKSMKDMFMPVAVHKGRLRMRDVIDRMNDRGTYSKETIENLVNNFHETAMELAADGYNVDAGLVYLRAMITGTNSAHEIDHKINKVVISAIPGKKLQKAGEQTKIELGRHKNVYKGVMGIGLPNLRDADITERSMVKIYGNHLKIAGEHPACGVFFIHAETKEAIQVPANPIVDNFPQSLLLILPEELVAGTYQLKITTCYGGNATLLKKPKIYEYAQPVVIHPRV